MTSKLRILFLTLIFGIAFMAKGDRNDTTVCFVNFYPGSDIYELEGHSALRITLPDNDLAISYGTYDFEQPNFVYRFVKGETDYWVTAVPWQYMEAAYRRDGRRIVSHHIDLTADQKLRLIELLAENLQPQNRTYRYNYVKDNCATRPLGMLEKALGDSISLVPTDLPYAGAQTCRSVMRHYHSNYPWYQFGIDLALGSGIDYTLSEREKSFAPVILDRQLHGATVGGKKLVGSVDVINDTAPDAAVLAPTPWYATPMTVCCLVLISAILLTFRDIRRHKVSRWFDAALYGIFGLAGCLISFLVFISVHEATSPNILLLWLNPLCFIPTIFIWIKRCRLIIFSYQIVNFVALLILIAFSIAGYQSLNTAFYPLILADAIRSTSYIFLNIKSIKCRV